MALKKSLIFPNRSFTSKGSSGGQEGGLQKIPNPVAGQVGRTPGGEVAVQIFEKILKSGKIEPLSTENDQCTRRKIRGFGSGNLAECFKILQNFPKSFKIFQNPSKSFKIVQKTSKCLKLLQNPSKCFKILENASKFFKILQNLSKSSKSFKMLQNISKCFKIASKCFKMLQNCSNYFKMLENALKWLQICFKLASTLLNTCFKIT